MNPQRLFWIALLLLVPSAVHAQDDKVFKLLTGEQTEEILRNLKIEFKKTPGKNNVVYYDYQRDKLGVRLYWFAGKDIMLDAVFTGMPLTKVNEWNVRAKFSRVCLHKDDKGEYTSLEANLDILGGVTEGTIRQFILGFDEEIKSFAKFNTGGSPTPLGSEDIYTKVSTEKLEELFTGLKIEFKKTELKGGAVVFDYEGSSHKLRLSSFAGGADIMIDAQFKKLPLAAVNEYNVKRKFIRAVAYNIKDREFTGLEANLDCAGGVTDSVVRHFIRSFDEEVKSFTLYVKEK